MSRSLRILLALLFGCAVTCRVGGAEYGFDLRQRGLRLTTSSELRTAEGVLRDGALAAGSTATAALAVGDRLAFQLFDDVETVLVLRERTESPLGGETFLAAAEGDSAVTAVVLQDANGITANVTDAGRGRVYTVVSTADGVTVREMDPGAGELEPCKVVVPDIPATKSRPTLTTSSTTQSSTLVDVMVAYDRNAARWTARHGGGITNFATMAVQKMNTALANAALDSTFRFRLVGVVALDADGGGSIGETLYAVQGGVGVWAAVGEMRDQVGADIVAVLVDTGSAYGTTGQSFSLKDSDVASFSEFSYSVCSVRAVAQSHTMTHEIGHVLGAGHSDKQSSQTGPQLYAYSSGYYFVAGDVSYHTIMAYADDGLGGSYVGIPFFSSPSRTYNGVAVGNSTHDNVRTIKNTYLAASKWREQKVPMSYDVFFSKESGTVFVGSTSITLTPGKTGVKIYYTLDGSTPTTDSTLYAKALTLWETTTIRAVTVTDGVVSPFVYEATYYASALKDGVDAPQLEWRTSEDYPWKFQVTNTFDGVDAVQSAWLPTGTGRAYNTWLETDVEGPCTMSFAFKRGYMYESTFAVLCDGTAAFEFRENGDPNDWRQVVLDIPAGAHVVRFNFNQRGCYGGVFNGIYLDEVLFDSLTGAPQMFPATTLDEATAATFTGSTVVTLVSPTEGEGTLYYTLDGSDPTGEGGIAYDGALVLTKSTLVRAVFVEPGKDPSAVGGGLYIERHPVRPGEWTTDVEGVKAAAAQDGRMICVMVGDYSDRSITQRFYDNVALRPEFLEWAAMNGVYLVRSDSSMDADYRAANDWFLALYVNSGDSGEYYNTRMYFVSPEDPMTPIGKGGAGGNLTKIGTVSYAKTVDSAVSGFASVLKETAPRAPTTTAKEIVTAFPTSVTLTKPTSTSTIHYTLDGSPPTRDSATYTGAISITGPTVLKAAAWNATGVSSGLLIADFKTYNELLGSRGLTWSNTSTYPWEVDTEAENTIRTPYVSDKKYSSTLQATVRGKGKLVFTLKVASSISTNKVTFTVGTATKYTFSSHAGGDNVSTVTLTNEVTTTSQSTFKWTYQVTDSSRNFPFNGAWLSDVHWVPEGSEVVRGGTTSFTPGDSGQPITVSNDWLFAKGLAHDLDLIDDVRVRLAATGANGIPRYLSYLTGLEPDSLEPAEEQLRVTILGFDSGGMPIIGHEPKPNDESRLRYVQLGKPDLDSDVGWTEVTDDNRSGMHYFKIRVEFK